MAIDYILTKYPNGVLVLWDDLAKRLKMSKYAASIKLNTFLQEWDCMVFDDLITETSFVIGHSKDHVLSLIDGFCLGFDKMS